MEKINYRSAVSTGITIFMIVFFAGLVATLLVTGAAVGLIVVGCVLALVSNLFMATYYTVSGDTLTVKSGVIINVTINISAITKIEPTHSVLSAPALSFDRLEVFYNKYDSIMVSPKDREGFINKLKEINPQIVVK